MPDALLFDLDGTLLDSDPLHREVFAELLAPYGHDVDADFYARKIHGRLNRDVFAELTPGLDRDRMDWDKEALFRDLLARRGANPTPGLVAFLDRAGQAALPAAVVTNACRLNAEAMLAALGLRDRFGAVISAEECAAGKAGSGAARPSRAAGAGLTPRVSADELRASGAHHVIQDFTDPALGPLLGVDTGAFT